MIKYSKSHEWIDVCDNIGIIGVSKYAQGELGEVVYVELPDCGKTIKKGSEIAVLESTKAAADVYSPVSGKVIAVNDILGDQPELINSSPESGGWLVKLDLSHPEELEELMDSGNYEEFIGT
jgi:glycine cleavage system H protein